MTYEIIYLCLNIHIFTISSYCNSRVLKFSPDGIVRMIINDDDLLRAERK